MIDAASEHDKPYPLTRLYSITRAQPANNSPGEISGHLQHSEHAARRVGHRNQVALIVLAGVIAKRSAELARGMLDHSYLAADRRAVYMDVERRHEHRHPMA